MCSSYYDIRPLARPLRRNGVVIWVSAHGYTHADHCWLSQIVGIAGMTEQQDAQGPLRTHRGGCHCGAVRFEFEAPGNLTAWDCNCSICNMKRNTHVIVPGSRFKLLSGHDNLSCYQFETKTAQHLFCKTCGVCSYYVPRSNPDGFSVTVHCIDPGTVDSVVVKQFDGKEWEKSYASSNIKLQSQPS